MKYIKLYEKTDLRIGGKIWNMAGGFDHFDENVNTVNLYYISFDYSFK